MTNQSVTDETPIAMLTVKQLKEVLNTCTPLNERTTTLEPPQNEKRYVYGIVGLEQLLNCSHATAQKIKNSGKLNGCYSQVGRKLVFDADAVLKTLMR